MRAAHRVLLVTALVAASLAVASGSPAFAAVTKDANAFCYQPYTAYDGSQQHLCADVYMPGGTAPAGGWPVVWVIHGSRSNGSKSSAGTLAHVFAGDGYLAVAPDYRLTCNPLKPPQGTNPDLCGFDFPSQPDDVEAAMSAFSAVASTYSANLDDVGMVGTSAGGNIALSVATNLGSQALGSTLKAVASLSGETDFSQGYYSPWVSSEHGDQSREVLGDQSYLTCGQSGQPSCATAFPANSVVDNVTPRTPPLYLGNAKDDVVPFQSAVELADVASAQTPPVPVFVRQAPGVLHGAMMLSTVVGANGVTTIEDEMVAFFQTLMQPSPTANLKVQATTSTTTPAVGAPVTDRFTITNLGPGWTSAGFATAVPSLAEAGSVQVSSSRGSCQVAAGTGKVSCALGLIPVQGQATVTLGYTPATTGAPKVIGTVSPLTFSLPNPPGATLMVPDPNLNNNRTAVTNKIGPEVDADLGVTGTATVGPPPSPGTPRGVSFDLQATNNSGVPVSDVVLTSAAPSGGIRFVSATPSQGSCTGGASLTCSLGLLGPGATASVTVHATADVPSDVPLSAPSNNNPIVDTVAVTGTNTEPANDPHPNTTQIQVSVPDTTGTTYIVQGWNGSTPSPAVVPLGGYAEWVSDTAAPPTQCASPVDPFPGLAPCYPDPSAWPAWDHLVADPTTMGLFTSPLIPPGFGYEHQFTAAGKYSVKDEVTYVVGKVNVPVQVAPSSGTQSSSFQVTWATEPAPPGFVYDVEILRPGSSSFVPWQTGVTVASASFVPDAGVGTYRFEARLRNPSVAGAVSGWCNGVPIKVTS